MNHGKQLRLFLPDGSAAGLRYYELVNWTGQALLVPVGRIKELVSGKWNEFRRPGVYFVRGQSEEGHPRLYIGESEDVGQRVQVHPSGLGFEVSEVLLFSSKDENLSKSHVLWLEAQLFQRVLAAKRIVLANSKQLESKFLSKPEQAAMEEFVEHVELVAQTAGFGYFTPPAAKAEESSTKLFLSMPRLGIEATAVRTDEGFMVFAGSMAAGEITPTLHKGYASQREELIDKGVLVPGSGNLLVFSADCVFASPSAAAAIIAGSPTSGPERWKNGAGKKLKQLIEEEEAES